MSETRFFATAINKKFFHVTEVSNIKNIEPLSPLSYLIVDNNGDEYVSSSRWSFNYSIYDDDTFIDFQGGKNLTGEYKREYVFNAGILNIYHPKKSLRDTSTGVIIILTKDNKIYRIRPEYIKCHKYNYNFN